MHEELLRFSADYPESEPSEDFELAVTMRMVDVGTYATPPSSAFSLGMHEESLRLSTGNPESGPGEDFELAVTTRMVDVGPYTTPPSSAFSLGMREESLCFSVDDPESGPGEDVEPAITTTRTVDVGVATPEDVATASRAPDGSPIEFTRTLDTRVTVTSTITDNVAANVDAPRLSVWVGAVVILACSALFLACCEIVGWGTRMGWTAAASLLIAPHGADRVLSRVVAALCSAAGVLTWTAAVAIWVSGRTMIERAARRPILPVFLEAVRNREKLSRAVVRLGWRGVLLGVGTAFGACAGTALLAAAIVAPATRAQRLLLATAVACLDAWALLYMVSVGNVRFYRHRLLTLALMFSVIATSFGLYMYVFVR